MSSRHNHKPNTKQCICNLCENIAHAVPGKSHRRCPGQKGQPIRAKHTALPSANRGTWE